MRVLVADCEPRVRFALRILLKRQSGLQVVGEAATADELLLQVEATRPDLVLLHWRLQERVPGLLPEMQAICPRLHVIVLSARPEVCPQALDTGADAFVCKIDPPEKLLAAIERIASDPSLDQRFQLGPGVEVAQKGVTGDPP